MIFAGGELLPDSELNPVLGYLGEEIAQTLSGPPLEADTVLDALEALTGELAPTDLVTREIAAATLCRLMESTHLIWN